MRRAREALGGEAAPADIAAHVEASFGVAIKPAIVRVLLGTLLQLERIDADRRRAQEILATAAADGPQPRKKGRKAKGREAPPA